MAKKEYQSVRGAHDRLPPESILAEQLTARFKALAAQAGYQPIETPIMEEAAVFTRTVGTDSDIVTKEMYEFSDRSGNELALRPEGTAPVGRAYLEHGMASWPQPVKLYYAGPMFRYDRPQAGRQRQFTHLGVEVMGEGASSIDAQVIILARRFFAQLGLKPSLQINSIGDAACREGYIKVLREYLESVQSKLPQVWREKIKTNPLRVLDCKDEGCRQVLEAAPPALDHLCRSCHQHFKGVLEYLDELDVPYELDHTLVRGLDYYSRTVFEFYGQRQGAQNSLGAGGRYDELIESLGGPATPAVGFSLGLERILLELAEQGEQLPTPSVVKTYVVSLGDPARLTAFRLIEEFLDAGIGTVGQVAKSNIQTQLGRADKLGVPYSVIIGQKEVLEGTCILRDMKTGAQEMIPLNKIVSELQRRFAISG